ncbi:hypothetical protein HT585_28480 [Ensifer sp. HO-A22]|uniref:Uncharacterized protein n=1 Tax=Ensifer oleiphilus TaxID=2742698 RepID=A0A7Y6QBX2_9HYPH|nr:hypothetical protein [Ensifer oleiphilus]NVD42815.1 hypothetical protein [Ensifer oleiphilus]
MNHADRAFAPANIAEPNEPTPADADFRVERQQARNWRISLLSTRASHWFEVNFAESNQSARVLETNLAGANAFIRKARMDGFRTEYIGPFDRSYF